MALILGDIYAETKQTFHLELIAGADGLSRAMKWVYVSEDVSVVDFLYGGELILTTGVLSVDRPKGLLRFIQALVAQNTCGLIVNIGKYLRREHITQEIIDYCNEMNFPLFLMPWSIHFYDITHAYYERLFQEDKRSERVVQALVCLLRQDAKQQQALDTLKAYHFPIDAPYYVVILRLSSGSSSVCYGNSRLLQHIVGEQLSQYPFATQLLVEQNNFIVILQTECLETVKKIAEELTCHVKECDKQLQIQIGISGQVSSLTALKNAVQQAQGAVKVGYHRHQPLLCYQELGFFKLPFHVQDKAVLANYVKEQLGAVMEYDRKHNRDFADTLYRYLLTQGNIQQVAEQSFCHRNTIHHRLHILQEQLHYRLNDPFVRFELMSAFMVQEYLIAEEEG